MKLSESIIVVLVCVKISFLNQNTCSVFAGTFKPKNLVPKMLYQLAAQLFENSTGINSGCFFKQ